MILNEYAEVLVLARQDLQRREASHKGANTESVGVEVSSVRTSKVLNENGLCVREGCRVTPDVIGRLQDLGLGWGSLRGRFGTQNYRSKRVR